MCKMPNEKGLTFGVVCGIIITESEREMNGESDSKLFSKLSENPLTNPETCAIIKVQKGERERREFKKDFEKNQKKLLTNPTEYGIINTERRKGNGKSPS